MKQKSTCRLAFVALFVLCGVQSLSADAAAQVAEASPAATSANRERQDTNLDVQLHLLVASNQAATESNVPRNLQAVVKDLKATLPFTNYSLGVTFLNRIRDGGTLQMKGVANSLLSAPAGSNPGTFYDFLLDKISLDRDEQGREIVKVPMLRFGMRVPITTATVPGEAGKSGYPVVNYEPIGMTTAISMHVGEPVIVGTLTTNNPDQILVLVAQIKRADAR